MLAIKVLVRLARRLRWALLILVTWVATATTGYRVIEGWSWFDCLLYDHHHHLHHRLSRSTPVDNRPVASGALW